MTVAPPHVIHEYTIRASKLNWIVIIYVFPSPVQSHQKVTGNYFPRLIEVSKELDFSFPF